MAKPRRGRPSGLLASRAMPAETGLVEPAAVADLVAALRSQLETPDAAMATLLAAPEPVAVAALDALREEAGVSAVPLLEQVAGQGRPGLAAGALAALAALRDPGAAAALARLGDTLTDRDLRKEARRALFHLRSQGISPPPTPLVSSRVAPTAPARATLYRALGSSIDGIGSRIVTFFADRPLGGTYQFVFLLNDLVGMKDFYVLESTRKKLAAREQELRERGETWVELPIDYALWLVQEALALNAESGFPVPVEYRAWQDVLGPPPRTFERPLVYEEVSRFEIKMRPELLQRTPELFKEPELEGWFLGYSDVRKHVEELRRAIESPLVLTPESDEQRVERILGQAIREFFTARQRRALQRRLEEMGYIFLRTGRPEQAKLAVAAAVEIADSDPILLTRHPFVRVFMQRSLMVALQALRAGVDPSAFDRRPEDPIDDADDS